MDPQGVADVNELVQINGFGRMGMSLAPAAGEELANSERKASLEDLLKQKRFNEIKKPSRIISFLYHPDELLRFRAAEALGYLCKGEKAREIILRLFWHLSDESGGYCVGAPLGIAEIGRSNPEIFEGFKNMFVSLLDNWEVERKYVAYGIGITAEIIRNAYPDPASKLREKISEIENAEFRAYALWALKKLGEGIGGLIERFKDSEELINFYNGERILRLKFRDFIQQL